MDVTVDIIKVAKVGSTVGVWGMIVGWVFSLFGFLPYFEDLELLLEGIED